MMRLENLFLTLKWPTKNMNAKCHAHQHWGSKELIGDRRGTKIIYLLEQNLYWGRWAPSDRWGKSDKDKSVSAEEAYC